MIARDAVDRWRSRPARERWLIGLPVVALLVVILYVLLWEPLSESTARLRARLPELEAREARVRAETTELRGYAAAATGGAPVAAVSVAQIQSAIDRQQLRGASPAIDRAGETRLRIVFPRIAFHSVWPLLQELQKNSGVRVTALRVDRVDAGYARFEATLAGAGASSR